MWKQLDVLLADLPQSSGLRPCLFLRQWDDQVLVKQLSTGKAIPREPTSFLVPANKRTGLSRPSWADQRHLSIVPVTAVVDRLGTGIGEVRPVWTPRTGIVGNPLILVAGGKTLCPYLGDDLWPDRPSRIEHWERARFLKANGWSEAAHVAWRAPTLRLHSKVAMTLIAADWCEDRGGRLQLAENLRHRCRWIVELYRRSKFPHVSSQEVAHESASGQDVHPEAST